MMENDPMWQQIHATKETPQPDDGFGSGFRLGVAATLFVEIMIWIGWHAFNG